MKASLIIFLVTSTFGIAVAQSKNDPTYSVHNYKHPNKAKEAAGIKSEGNQNLAYKEETSSSARNYKAFAHPNPAAGAVMNEAPIEMDSPSVASNGNYKSIFGKKKEEVQSSKPLQTPDSSETPLVNHKNEAHRKNH